MKQHTTNYTNTFIETAADCPAATAQAPPEKQPKTAAQIQFEMLSVNPYRFSSDDIVYAAAGQPKGISREAFFAKGQPCLRASALAKRYGWGFHFDQNGRVAIYAAQSADYKRLAADPALAHFQAMRSGKQ